jgi:hypothetical protein
VDKLTRLKPQCHNHNHNHRYQHHNHRHLFKQEVHLVAEVVPLVEVEAEEEDLLSLLEEEQTLCNSSSQH